MAHELQDPRHALHHERPVGRAAPVGAGEVVHVRCASDEEGCEDAAGDGLHEDVEEGVENAGYGAEVGREVGELEEFGHRGDGEELDVCSLHDRRRHVDVSNDLHNYSVL